MNSCALARLAMLASSILNRSAVTGGQRKKEREMYSSAYKYHTILNAYKHHTILNAVLLNITHPLTQGQVYSSPHNVNPWARTNTHKKHNVSFFEKEV